MSTTLVPSYSRSGLGDIVADLEALASLASAAGSSGGISAWMQAQISQFNALPNVVANLQSIINTLNGALTSAGVSPSAVTGLTQAQSDLTNITASFPTVQQQLGILGVTLYPALASGNVGLSTITQVSSQGGDVVATFNGMQQLFAYREDARSILLSIASNPALPVATQQQVTAALQNLSTLSVSSANSIGTYLVYGAVAFVGYKLLRLII